MVPLMSGLTLPSLAAGALGRVSANTSRPGGPDQAGTEAGPGRDCATRPPATATLTAPNRSGDGPWLRQMAAWANIRPATAAGVQCKSVPGSACPPGRGPLGC